MISNRDENVSKQWAKTQEGLLELIDTATAINRLMERNRTAAVNPARQKMLEAVERRIDGARAQLAEMEKEIPEGELDQFHHELEQIKRIRQDT